MTDTKPTTSWAVASLVSSILGCLANLALLALLEQYGEMANRSAGVGIIGMGLHGLLTATLCLLGFLFGIIALIRISSGEYKGRGKAWAGIALGCLPLALVVIFLLSGDANPLRQ